MAAEPRESTARPAERPSEQPSERLAETLAVALAVSTVMFAMRPSATSGAPSIWLPLVRRIREPQAGAWALPGGPLGDVESLTAAASRTLAETTGLAPRYLEQLYAFGEVDRSPGPRVVSVVYWALVSSAEAQTLDPNVRWVQADDLPPLAFDHNLIVEYALWRLRTKVGYSRIAHAFLGETFTIAELRSVHEAVRGRPLDPANFRRMIESSDAVVPTGERQAGARHRPARIYRYNEAIDFADNGPIGSNAGAAARRAEGEHA